MRRERGYRIILGGWVILFLAAWLVFPALASAQGKEYGGTAGIFDQKLDHPILKKFRSKLHYINPLSYGGLDAAISHLNPIGNALDPIEEAVPGLFIKGFLRNRTVYKFRGAHGLNAKPRPGANNDYNKSPFEMVEWLEEIEVHYAPPGHPSIEFITILNHYYNSVYDWFGPRINSAAASKGKKLFDRDFEYTSDTNKILREAYLDWYATPDFHLRLGKQQLPWGKMDHKVIDVINPAMGWLTGPQALPGNDEWGRIPTWMITGEYTWGDYMLQGLATWDYQPSEGAPVGHIFGGFPSALPGIFGVKTADEPSESFENGEYGLKFNFLKGGWDTSLIYWYAWDDTRIGFVRPDGIEAKPTRIHHFGFAQDKSFYWLGRNWMFRTEAMYKVDTYAPNFTEFGNIVGAKLSGGPWPVGHRGDGFTKINQLAVANTIESYLFRDWNFLILNQVFHRFKYDNKDMNFGSLIKETADLFLYNVNHPFKWTDDRLTISCTFYHWLDNEFGLDKVNFSMAYTFSDYLRVWFNAMPFAGRSDEIYGRQREQSSFRLNMSYNF